MAIYSGLLHSDSHALHEDKPRPHVEGPLCPGDKSNASYLFRKPGIKQK